MAIYDELYHALLARWPDQIAIDQALRDFPNKLKNAIREYIGAPQGLSRALTLYYNCDTEYVDLCKTSFDESGHRIFVRDDKNIGDGLYIEKNGESTYRCCIAIAFDHDTFNSSLLSVYLMIYISDFDARSITFGANHLHGKIAIDNVADTVSYKKAAKILVDMVLENTDKATFRSGLKNQVGFISLS